MATRASTRGVHPTILLVDDDARFLSLVRRLLVRNGFNVLAADDGSEVPATLTTTPVDAIVLDLQMPGMNGCEVLRTIRDRLNERQLATGVRPKVVVLSGRDETETAAFVSRLGADAFLTKPLGSAEIVQTLRGLLARRGS